MKELKNYLEITEGTDENVLVHHDCHPRFVDKQKAIYGTLPIKNLRSSLEISFNWKLHWFFVWRKC